MFRMVLCALCLMLPLGAQAQKPADRRADLEKMLDALRVAPDEESAGKLEAHIRQLWFESGSSAVTLLMGRGLRDMKAGAHDQAVEVFDDVIVLDPALAEAWHQRAVAKFHAGDRMGAIRDIEETLKREPRHFAAHPGGNRGLPRGLEKCLCRLDESDRTQPENPGRHRTDQGPETTRVGRGNLITDP